jgi:membrane protein implicated in regulation of membrane protease activity
VTNKASRIASFGIACGLLVLAMHGTASAVGRVPEIDPGLAGSGVALLTGTALLLIERFLRR